MKHQQAKHRFEARMCVGALALTTALTLASGIGLEINGSSSAAWVWTHVAVGCIFIALIAWHIYIHFGLTDWYGRLFSRRRGTMKWMSALLALTVLTALAASAHRIATHTHSATGGIHGKVGLVFVILAIIHGLSHRRGARRMR